MHADNSPFNVNMRTDVKMKTGRKVEQPSDQGAYLSFYADSKKFLAKEFNVKPYYTHTPPKIAKIIHFHGAKPHDYIGEWLGISCSPAIKKLCEKKERNAPILCWR